MPLGPSDTTPDSIPAAPVHCSLRPGDRITRERLIADVHTLALVTFGDSPSPGEDPRQIQVPLSSVQASPPVEVWHSREPVATGREEQIAYSRNSDLMFAHISIPETDSGELERATDLTYRRLYGFLDATGYRHPLRVWNFFSDIHLEHEGLDRYQAFCVGRHRALGEGIDSRELPAATVIGTRQAGLLIYVLAGRDAGTQVENPRQVSAFHYPPDYGPQSPSFSRAMMHHWPGGSQLFISGTASIVGYASRHPSNPSGQLAEILENLNALIRTARETGEPGIADVSELSLVKVYLRDPDLYPGIESALSRLAAPSLPRLFLQGDICRQDLLLEIEGLYTGPARERDTR